MTDMSKEAISTERALKLALEALESCGTGHISDGGSQWYDEMLVDTTIAVLREALTSVPDWASEAKEQPAQQKPVAWLDPWTRNNVTTDYDAYGKHGIPLYKSPPASKPLTDEQIAEIAAQGHQRWIEFARAIEAAHGIKGDA